MRKMPRLPRVLALFASVLACGIFASTLAGGQVLPDPPLTTPAEKMGWWVRVNPANQANRVYWRFGLSPDRLGAPMTWADGISPQALDVAVDQRMGERVHIASMGLPGGAPVSFCVFFENRGVTLVEFTGEKTLEVDRAQSTEQCVP